MKINEALNGYIPIANLIAKTFGENCEVVIHDLSVPQNSVIYAVNNHVTGRTIGQSFDHLVKQVLLSRNFHGDYTANYMTTTKDGKEIKSSTSLIRNANGEVIGALCVNYDLEAMKDMKKFLDDFLHVEEEEQITNDVEPFEHVMEIVDDLIDKIVGNVNVDDLKRKDKISLIHFMEKKGIFLMKGAIEKVASKLNISKVTVYSYLDEIKKSSL
ncbi:helix-turn-helix transcriptional regulator [Crassaminicella profunda]|uniref:helix-turn-helix transcriptional regulator n=1 Tax=Crassaminicella profunda TaxID=1286698 RepID=UPI001CA655A7|nr:PAS domain-containing protein [Crassaminicella profunda]QZY56166.1 PAS domain-containing protein [Crassaminicella profunda]